MNSAGSAEQENAIYMESLEGKLKNLNSAWQSFATSTIDSDWIKNILTSLTELIKFTDKIGGLPTILATATSALLLFKGGLILDKTFKAFSSGLSLIKNGLGAIITALPNAIAAFKSFSSGVISASTAIQAATPLFSVIALAITGAVAALNAYKKAQKEANEAAVESSKKAKDEISTREKTIETTEDEIKKLKEEKEFLEKQAEAGGNNAEVSKKTAEEKQKEIDKRQENIDKMKKENEEALKQREAASRSMTTNKSDNSLGWLKNQKEILDAGLWRDYKKEVDSVNESLKETDNNTGAYQKTLESLRAKYEGIAQTKEKNNESSVIETNIIKELNTEIEQNKEKYEEDKKVADEFYSIIKDGGSISQENLEWMQDFLDLSDEQIEQLKEGIDVLNEQTEATGNYIDAVGGLTDAQKEMQDSLTYTDEELKNINDDIDNTQSAYATLVSAVDEYNSSGGITMDTLQQLLSLDSEYLNSLELVNGKLQISQAAQNEHSKAMETDTLALIENAAMEDLMAMATEGAGNTASAAGSKIYSAGENAKKAGDYAREGAQGFIELAGAMSQAGMIDPNSGVDTKAWADKWAGITNKIKGLTSGAGSGGGLTSPRFTGGSGRSGRKSSGGSGRKSGSGKKSGSGSSKSTKEEYKAEIDTLYAYKNAVENAKESVDKLKDAIKDTDNFNEQEKYIRQVIDALNDEINKTNDLKNAQTGQINDYINQLRAQGFSIDYNAQKNELYINNMQHLADFSGDTAKKLEKLIKKTQDLNDDNRDLDGTIRDLRSDVKDYYEQLEDIPEKKLKKFNELMKEFQQGRLEQIQNQIDDIQHEMDNDPRLQQLENQIEALENQNDELDKQKELEEKLLAVEEAKEKLANARRQKTLQVYRERKRVRMGRGRQCCQRCTRRTKGRTR